MATLCAILVLTLDDGTGLDFLARHAWDGHRLRDNLALNCFVAIVLEPHPLQPVHADGVRP